MVFIWRLRDSDSTYLSNTFLSIRADFAITVTWMVLLQFINALLLILRVCSMSPNMIWIFVNVIFFNRFIYSSNSLNLYTLNGSFVFTVLSDGAQASTRWLVFLLMFIKKLSRIFWFGLGEPFYSKVADNTMHIIFNKDVYWFVHIPYFSRVNV